MKKLLIIGAGGMGKEAAWVAADAKRAGMRGADWEILGFADDNRAKLGALVYGFPVLGTFEELAAKYAGGPLAYYCAVAAVEPRRRLVAQADSLGWTAATLIHPSVILADDAVVGKGTYVGALSVLSPSCRVGNHALINQRVTIGHDAVVEDFATVFCGAQINGGCVVGEAAVLGSNATLQPAVCIGDSAVVASNSAVLRNVDPGVSVIGVPARPFFQRARETQ